MNGTNPHISASSSKLAPPKPSPTGPVPLPPSSANSAPPLSSNSPSSSHHPAVNGIHSQRGKKKPEPVDPATMYENLKSRIAALEEEEEHGEEEQRKIGESATTLIDTLTIKLQPMKRVSPSKVYQIQQFRLATSNW